MNQSKTNIILIILSGIILILLYIIIFRGPDTNSPAFDDTALRNQIKQKEHIIKAWKEIAKKHELTSSKFEAKSDSLQNTKPQIKHYYHEIYKFNSTATSNQLDSIIRSNW